MVVKDQPAAHETKNHIERTVAQQTQASLGKYRDTYTITAEEGFDEIWKGFIFADNEQRGDGLRGFDQSEARYRKDFETLRRRNELVCQARIEWKSHMVC